MLHLQHEIGMSNYMSRRVQQSSQRMDFIHKIVLNLKSVIEFLKNKFIAKKHTRLLWFKAKSKANLWRVQSGENVESHNPNT